jgi:hypothetical protein
MKYFRCSPEEAARYSKKTGDFEQIKINYNHVGGNENIARGMLSTGLKIILGSDDAPKNEPLFQFLLEQGLFLGILIKKAYSQDKRSCT